MNKIDIETKYHFDNSIPFNLSNTTIIVDNNGVTNLILYGNIIAKKHKNGKIFVNNCGYATDVTKRRLNAIGAGIYQKHFKWYFKNGEFKNNEWNEL